MTAITIRLPEELKERAMRLAKKKMSFNSLVNHWLQDAVVQDETTEWLKRQLSGSALFGWPALLHASCSISINASMEK